MSRIIEIVLLAGVVGMMAMTAMTANAAKVEDYNLIWNSPSKDFNGSMPIGNGDIGLNVWFEKNGELLFYIGKTDCWSENGRLLKLGRVRIKLSPNPLAGHAPFKQILRLRQGEILIKAGHGSKAVKLRIWVDANRPVIRIEADSTSPFRLQTSLEVWRKQRRKLTGNELSRSASGINGAPFPVYVEPDTIIDNRKDNIIWYHRNERSIWANNLKHQGMADFIQQSTDPLLHRTFGACISGTGLKSKTSASLASIEPQKHYVVSIYPLCAQTESAEKWMKQLSQLVQNNSVNNIENDRKKHQEWWNNFWNRSWIFMKENSSAAAPDSLLAANNHSVKIGVDQHGRNKYFGEIRRVSIIKNALSNHEVKNLFQTAKDSSISYKKDVFYSGKPKLYQTIDNSSNVNDKTGLTLEAWINPKRLPGGGARIIDKSTPGTNNGFLLDTCPGNSLRLITQSGTLNVANALPVDKWSHIAAVIDFPNGKIKLFLNGKVVATKQVEKKIDAATVVSRGYILQRWITACGGRGKFPIKFNGSIFTVDGVEGRRHFDADYRRWGGCYWWQNTRLPYWPMLASGDFDMMNPMFKMYSRMLPLEKYRTKTWYGHDGAFIGETIYFWGMYNNNNYGWKRNKNMPVGLLTNPFIRREYTASPELMSMMFDYYVFTGDEAFLNEVLLPMCDSLLEFWDKHYKNDAGGKLEMYPAQSLETFQKVKNPTPDIAGLHWVLKKLLSLGDKVGKDRIAFWKQLSKRVPSLPMAKSNGREYITVAKKIFEKPRNSENPELYAIFPFRLYGMGKPDIEVARRTFKLRSQKRAIGWTQDDIQAAFLGLTETAARYVTNRAKSKHKKSRFPAFWGPNFDWIPDQDHGGNLMMTLQTMLMQCEDNKILLLPAWPMEWDVNFKLHAPYQTTVEGKVQNGKVIDLKVTPESRRKDIILPNEIQ